MQTPDASPFVPLDVSFIKRKWLDVPYATASPAQRLDLYLPEEGDGPFPTLIYIHGGGFELGDKRDAPLRPFLAGLERGYAVASVNYRLSSEAVFPAAVMDAKAAVRWLRAEGEDYGLDSSRIAVCGDSAGGNLAAMIGVTEHTRDFDDPTLGQSEQSSGVQAVIDWFGPVDFTTMQDQLRANALRLPPGFPPPVSMLEGGPGVTPPSAGGGQRSESAFLSTFEERYLGTPVAVALDLARAAGPLPYLHSDIPPILIQHGSLDPLVPVQQSFQFARAIEERVGPGRCELDILEGAGHGGPEFETEENMARVFAFLGRALGAPSRRGC